jgi:hypothetical protein
MKNSKKRSHEDTTVSLHPLTFDEAMAKLAKAKRTDSPTEESDSTTEPARESAPSKKRTAPYTVLMRSSPATYSAGKSYALAPRRITSRYDLLGRNSPVRLAT